MTRPGVLLHVGFHKAGSSWLEAWLTRHPQIQFVAGTFGGHANPIDVCRQVARQSSDARWVAMSEENWTGGLVFPEGYFYLLLRHQGFHRRPPTMRAHQERLADELASLFPHARVLVITRGFAAALRSVYSQVVRIGGDVSFPDFLREYELQIGRVLPSLSARQLAAYSSFSRRVLGPVARHLRNYRAMQLYMLYARYVVDQPWSDGLVQGLFARSAKAELEPVPAEYLDRFRGSATTLATLRQFAPYRAAYLLAPEVSA